MRSLSLSGVRAMGLARAAVARVRRARRCIMLAGRRSGCFGRFDGLDGRMWVGIGVRSAGPLC